MRIIWHALYELEICLGLPRGELGVWERIAGLKVVPTGAHSWLPNEFFYNFVIS